MRNILIVFLFTLLTKLSSLSIYIYVYISISVSRRKLNTRILNNLHNTMQLEEQRARIKTTRLISKAKHTPQFTNCFYITNNIKSNFIENLPCTRPCCV